MNCKWIWLEKEEKNSFAEFKENFEYSGGEAKLFISADYRYVAFVNGKMSSCHQYADLPNYKSVNEANITHLLKKGENTLFIICWHIGECAFVWSEKPASCGFEITIDGKTAAYSSENTLSRKSSLYKGGEVKTTPQLGFGFDYDFIAKEAPFRKSRAVETNFNAQPRPIKDLTLTEPLRSKVVAQGVFKWNDLVEGETSARRMGKAWLLSKRFSEMTGKNRMAFDCLSKTSPLTFKSDEGDGIFVTVDLEKETAGYLAFGISVDEACSAYIAWGEHLSDLRVRSEIGGRNFALNVSLKKGENVLDDYLQRLGLRYLTLFVESEKVSLSRLTVREVGYPFAFPKKDFGDKLLNQIYEVGRRTMYLCAHDHYEDCPWREQALYGMDSRNQMLFGYGAFKEYDYPRASMLLFARSMENDGFLQLCAPAKTDITIPSFTAYWIIAICENAEVDYNDSFVREILPYAEKGLEALLRYEREVGIVTLKELKFWNFHEWSEGLEGVDPFKSEESKEKGDCILTALTSVAAKKLALLERKVGRENKALELEKSAYRLKNALNSYYDEERKVYASYIADGSFKGYHVATQAVVLFAEGADEERAKEICNFMKEPEKHGLIPATFAVLQMKYDAIIKYLGDLDFCVKEIVELFGGMIFSGATSYWETANGEADFDDAGSLCHGWASAPCYIFDKYLKSKGEL